MADAFELNGKQYNYIRTRATTVSERCVEVSLGYNFLNRASQPVEVGNVMRTHFPQRDHLTIDLMEKHPGWKNYFNEDLLAWDPPAGTDRVLSISTVEHCEDPEAGLRRLLTWAPEVLITIPLGYFGHKGIATTELALKDYAPAKVSFMARSPVVDTGLRDWRQISREEVLAADPGKLRWGKLSPPHQLTAVAICVIQK